MTAGLISLRDYQKEALDAVRKAWDDGMRRPAVVLPCGAGKTILFAHLAAEFVEKYRQQVLILVNRDELADQSVDKVRSVAPGIRVGKVKAQDDDVHADVVVASVQTLSRPNRLARLLASPAAPIGLVICDEVHFAAAESFKRIFDAMPPYARFLGVTATLARGDGVGLGNVVDDVVYSRSVMWMISRGYLSDVRGQLVTAEGLDLGGVRRTGGDYQAGALGDAMIDSGANRVTALAYAQYAADRPGLVFTPSVAAAHDVAKELETVGITAAVVTGETPREERLRIYDASRTGRVQVMCNCSVLTTGFDAPWISCVVPKPTRSATLEIQMIGRGMRLWPGKQDALILSIGGSTGSIRTLIDLAPGEVESVQPGESLAEAVLRESEEAQAPVASGSLAFALKHREMDLFSASSNNWVRTPKGVMCIPCADRRWVFLWPSAAPGLWDVCVAGEGPTWRRLREGLPIGTAQAWCETEAEDRAGYGTSKTAPWMRKKASDKQLETLRRMGLPTDPSMKAGEAGALMDQAFATRTFDRYVRRG